MIDLAGIKDVYLYTGTTDMRAGLRSLSVKAASDFDGKDMSGCLFLFCGRDRKSMKALELAEDGTWLYQKRLDSGRFKWPQTIEKTKITLEEHRLRRLLSGLSIVSTKHGSDEKHIIRY